MRNNLPRISLGKLCGWFGMTRQAYYQNCKDTAHKVLKEDLILQEVSKIRQLHPRMGTRKLHVKLMTFLDEHEIKLGRDGLFDLLSSNYLLVRRRRRTVRTTNSTHWLRKYLNLTKGLIPTAPNQLWVSDITYWKISGGKHVYISFGINHIFWGIGNKLVTLHGTNTLDFGKFVY